MLKRYSFFIGLGLLFLVLSILGYSIHFLIFRDTHHIFIYLLGDLAFLPLEVLIVIIVIERILSRREKQAMMKKLNMVIGAFFSEIGSYLLDDLLNYFDNRDEIARRLNVNPNWEKKDFKEASDFAYNLLIKVNNRDVDLEKIKAFLAQKRVFLLTLLVNPNLLEHDRFTNLLWATTHLDEELEARPTLKDLPAADLEHIAGDIQRLYDHLASEWLNYVEHLKSNYPFFFSLILRTHPFQEKQSPILGR